MITATLHVKLGHGVITMTADMPEHRTRAGVIRDLNEWFTRDAGDDAPFKSGTLLFYSLAGGDSDA